MVPAHFALPGLARGFPGRRRVPRGRQPLPRGRQPLVIPGTTGLSQSIWQVAAS
jgi:hypothetical protein